MSWWSTLWHHKSIDSIPSGGYTIGSVGIYGTYVDSSQECVLMCNEGLQKKAYNGSVSPMLSGKRSFKVEPTSNGHSWYFGWYS